VFLGSLLSLILNAVHGKDIKGAMVPWAALASPSPANQRAFGWPVSSSHFLRCPCPRERARTALRRWQAYPCRAGEARSLGKPTKHVPSVRAPLSWAKKKS
jgi:hypothetical protein